MSFSDKLARKQSRQEALDKFHNVAKKSIIKVPIIVSIRVIKTTFNTPTNFHLWINVEGSLTSAQSSESRTNSFLAYWDEDPSFQFMLDEVSSKGLTLDIKVINDKSLKILCDSLRTCASLNYDIQAGLIGDGMESSSTKMVKPFFDFDNKEVGQIEFELNINPIPHFGLKYWKRLPVMDPDTKIPEIAMPSPSFVHHDEFNEMIVAFVIVYWLLRGEKHAWDMLPPNVQTRTDASITDSFFVYRRLNGCNRPYNIFTKVSGHPWDYELRLSFTGCEKKKDVWMPDKTCCNFKLIDDELVIVNIQYQMEPDGEVFTQVADGSDEWNLFKIKYMMIEFNYNITWAHVGVHFIVEMYSMAFYRNIVKNPIQQLLWPHFDGVIFNNWLVVRPMYNGVVTMAAALTYEGQVKMLEDKFKDVTYRWKPESLPENIKNNTYDTANNACWQLISEYVDEFFAVHSAKIQEHWDEIENVSRDLVAHQLNDDPNANAINNMQDLRDCCVYIIYQAVFQHAWIHWKAWDDEAQAVMFNKDGETPLKDILYEQNLGNAIEAGVQYPSAYVRHYPILDHEFGGPEGLQRRLWEHAHKINPGISVGSLVMSPNI
ncbi:hypothetical protein SAMD00019534_102060 [Acytostelium subglobosum LB1]|uniref:hypothetical protein n=1 Tax=Acytostelium subglobosum LB1 TaxID=1410327 RepID=UPI000644C680|nr:hypothetical protein SAMD00019534_102060 [Acytostelium subglobosum LB1]GAM27031.1 hypothetical protein SAMD00019534_102060 [Acytostelium subglobosum LB1]|eukprot:XP_012749911.1 hypothetical protein SAMD00019534_102060 [Acytostelium subglobosum LB1]